MKTVILLYLFVFCNGEYPPALPDDTPDSYGPPQDSYIPPFLSDNYDPPVSDPGDSYGPPPSDPSDSYGLPKVHSIKAKAKSTSAKSPRVRVAKAPPKASAPISFSADLVVPSGVSFGISQPTLKASPAVTQETLSAAVAEDIPVSIPDIIQPPAIPLPPIVPPVPELPPNILPPIPAPVQVPLQPAPIPQVVIQSTTTPAQAAVSVPVQSAALPQVSVEGNSNPVTQLNPPSIRVLNALPTYSSYQRYILPSVTPHSYSPYFLHSSPLRSSLPYFTQQQIVPSTLTNVAVQPQISSVQVVEPVTRLSVSSPVDAAPSTIQNPAGAATFEPAPAYETSIQKKRET